MVRPAAQALIETGKVSHNELGVRVQDLTPALAEAMGIKISSEALVSQVTPGSPAAKAGIKFGDVIIDLDGNPVVSGSALRVGIGEKAPGTTVRLVFFHDGKKETATATIEPQQAAPAPPPPKMQQINAFCAAGAKAATRKAAGAPFAIRVTAASPAGPPLCCSMAWAKRPPGAARWRQSAVRPEA